LRSRRGNVVISRIRFITIAVAALALHASVGATAADYEKMDVVDIKLDAPKLAANISRTNSRLLLTSNFGLTLSNLRTRKPVCQETSPRSR
jgi:uncharacterized SAM-dependent methyltransferase